MAKNQLATSNINRLKKVLDADSVKKQFENALDENSGAFVASIIDLYSSDNYLQNCDPNKVVMEALKAATLKLPINKQLGFAYIVPYKKKGTPIPQFQIGYKGYIQLAMRTGQYRYINSGHIYEGINIEEDLLTGRIQFIGDRESDEVVGYFAYMELLNGFSKTVYMTKEEVIKHAEEYSPSYNYSSSAWQTNFDAMGEKTVLRQLLSKYGILSTEMITAFTADSTFNDDSAIQEEIENNANSETIDINPVDNESKETDKKESDDNNSDNEKKSGQMSIEEDPDPGF